MRVLNLGCGGRVDPHAGGGERRLVPVGAVVVHHDRVRHSAWVDVGHDLRVLPWPWSDGAFDLVVAFDVLEHLPDTVGTLDEIWRVVRPGGELIVHTNNVEFPEQAWRDPTHVKVFEWESFDFFDPETRWGSEYGRFYSDRPWRVVSRERDGLELLFRLVKRGSEQPTAEAAG